MESQCPQMLEFIFRMVYAIEGVAWPRNWMAAGKRKVVVTHLSDTVRRRGSKIAHDRLTGMSRAIAAFLAPLFQDDSLFPRTLRLSDSLLITCHAARELLSYWSCPSPTAALRPPLQHCIILTGIFSRRPVFSALSPPLGGTRPHFTERSMFSLPLSTSDRGPPCHLADIPSS